MALDEAFKLLLTVIHSNVALLLHLIHHNEALLSSPMSNTPQQAKISNSNSNELL